MKKDSRIYVAGHRGLVGSALWRRLCQDGCQNLLGRTHEELDLLDAIAVRDFFRVEQPEYVFLAAARVGGIKANDARPADFIYENLQLQNNVVHAAHSYGVKKLLFLGSSCIYPKMAEQPMREETLLTGPLEPTNQWYAVAKIAGIKLCQAYRRQYGDDFISALPANLYGSNDNYDLENSHVLPALIRRFHEAKRLKAPQVVLWGTGSPLREFLHADDLAGACIFLMQRYCDESIINVGSGQEVSIRQLAQTIREVVGYQGSIEWDPSKPDGTPRKLMDSSRIRDLGWAPSIGLSDGIREVYAEFLQGPLA